MKFIGIDAGNSGCKYAYFKDGQLVYGCIPNVTGKAIALDIPPTGIDERVLAVQVLSADEVEQRQPVFVGELAKQQLQEYAQQDRSRNKAESDAINLIVPTVLGLLWTGDKIALGIGATLQDYADQAPLLQKKLTKKHEIKFNLGSKVGRIVRPEVEATYTYAQAAAGLISLLKDDDGQIRRAEWANQTVIALDFGHGQVNVALMEKLQFIKKSCFSLDYGFYRIVLAVQNYLNAKPYYITATIPQLQNAVERGFFVWKGQQIDLTEVIDECCAKIVDLIYNEVMALTSNASVDTMVVMGGAASIMIPFIGARFGYTPELAMNSMYANARGLLLIAKEKWEKENDKGTSHSFICRN